MNDIKNDLKSNIISILKEHGRCTLPALANSSGIVELAKGDKNYGGELRGKKANILYVKDVNTDFTSAIDEMIAEEIIELSPSNVATATIDGFVYKEYPIADDIRVFSTTHWLPVDVRCGKKFPK